MTADPKKLKISKNLGFEGIIFGMDRMPESSQLFYGGSDFKVYELDTAAEKPQPVALSGEGHFSYVMGVAVAGEFVVTGSYDGRLIWWDAQKKQQVRAIDAHDKWIRGVVASPDRKLIASAADDMLCKIWDTASGSLVHTLNDHKPLTPNNYPSMLYAVAFSPDGKLLATGDKVGHVAVWEVSNGKKLAELETPVMYTWDPRQRRHSIGGIRSVAFSHDSKLLAVGGMGKVGNIDHLGGESRVEVFDWQAGKRIHELTEKKMKGLVEQIEFHPSGDWFVCAGGDHNGFVRFYDAKQGEIIHEVKAPMHVHRFVFNEAFDTLYAVGHGRVVVWELKAEEAKPAAETDKKEKAAG